MITATLGTTTAPTSAGSNPYAPATPSNCGIARGITMHDNLAYKGYTLIPTGNVNEWTACPPGVSPTATAPGTGSIDSLLVKTKALTSNLSTRYAAGQQIGTLIQTSMAAGKAGGSTGSSALQWAKDNWQYLAAGGGVLVLAMIILRK